MDQKQVRKNDPASEEITGAARQSFQMLADRTVSLQESNLKLTQTFFQNFMQQLRSQNQENPQAAENLQQLGQEHREALEALSQEATNTYSDFLNSALSFYQETLNTATQVAQNNVQSATQATQQGVQAGMQAASQAIDATNRAVQASAQAVNQAGQQGREPAALDYAGSDRTAAIQLIDELLAEDPRYDEETWPEIAEALDRDRLSDRKLFVD